MLNEELHKIVNKVMSGHKGILASDESPSSIDKKLVEIGVEANEENRRRYREIFINTPDLEKYINGIILHEETLWQADSNGKEFRKTLLEKGIEIIIKVDRGLVELPDSPQEVFTAGLETLSDRLPLYHETGAKLAKWRSAIRIGENIPTQNCLDRNAQDLADYALLCQTNYMVPIVEPEVLIDGDHDIGKAEEVTTRTLKTVFEHLKAKNVDLKGTMLKTSMVLQGKDYPNKATPVQVAETTVRTLLSSVPEDLGAVVFLSGGQGPQEATANLNEIAKKEPLPWGVAFSFLRAIEGPAATAWQGQDENVEAARNEFIKRLKLNVTADAGEYGPHLEESVI